MTQPTPIYCQNILPDGRRCNHLVFKQEVSDGELIEAHYEKCKTDWIFKIKIEAIPFIKNEKVEK